MLKLDGLSAFVAVAEAGSISNAARRLGLAKSVVSERLADLEAALGAKLIHRTTRRLSLTEDGAAFLQRASAILHDLDSAAADLAARRGELTGPLRLSAPVTFGRMHLGPALYPFLKAHPAIELSLELDDRRVDAAAEGFDAVLRHGPVIDSRLMVWRLAPSRRLLVAAPEYLGRHGRPRKLSDLDAHRGVFYSNRGAADWRFPGKDGAVNVQARVALRVNNGDLLLGAAKAGLGIALLPTFIAGEALKAGELEAIDIGVQAEREFIYLATPEGRQAPAKLRALAESLRTAFGEPPYWETA